MVARGAWGRLASTQHAKITGWGPSFHPVDPPVDAEHGRRRRRLWASPLGACMLSASALAACSTAAGAPLWLVLCARSAAVPISWLLPWPPAPRPQALQRHCGVELGPPRDARQRHVPALAQHLARRAAGGRWGTHAGEGCRTGARAPRRAAARAHHCFKQQAARQHVFSPSSRGRRGDGGQQSEAIPSSMRASLAGHVKRLRVRCRRAVRKPQPHLERFRCKHQPLHRAHGARRRHHAGHADQRARPHPPAHGAPLETACRQHAAHALAEGLGLRVPSFTRLSLATRLPHGGLPGTT